MTYDHTRHHRHSIRYPGFDYASANAYFVTICTHARLPLFGEVVAGETLLNELGMIAQTCWAAISDHLPSVLLDAYVIMPNHLHGIILIGAIPDPVPGVGAMHASPSQRARPFGSLDGLPLTSAQSQTSGPGKRVMHASPLHTLDPVRPYGLQPRSLGSIAGSFKSAVTRRINEYWGTPSSPVWQRSFHDRIIRGDAELDRIREYIENNPGAWQTDHENPAYMPPSASVIALPSPYSPRYEEHSAHVTRYPDRG